MRRQIRDELIHGFLAINAMLREESKELRRQVEARRAETKYNWRWRDQPRAPRGTAEGGQWIDSTTLLRPREGRPTPTGGDPMDGSDAAMFGEMLHFEFTRGRYRLALDATQDARERARIADERAMLARHVFGAYAGEEVENIYAEEMRGRRGRIAFGSTDLSQRAFRLRPRSDAPTVGEGRNIAVIEYRGADGRLHYIEQVSQPGRHAEQLAAAELERLRIPADRVTRIYTDRQPCSERCRRLVRRYRNARVTWAVDWPDGIPGRDRANDALDRQIRSYRRMESQGTLPLPLWRYPHPAGNDPPGRRRRRRR